MNGNRGFTYTAALALILITGISLMGAQKYWSTIAKREIETELLFRGDQIRNGIASYYRSAEDNSHRYPASLNDLLRDPRFPAPKRHLRKLYLDPVTRTRDWELVLISGNRIKGVYSKSLKKPLKTGNFPKDYTSFENSSTYSDWKFIFDGD